MPVEVFEDSLDLFVDLLNEETLTEVGYPYPQLSLRGEKETRRFRSIVLENEYLRLTFIPALGGRLLSLFDKRTQQDVLQTSDSLAGVAGGIRGVQINAGIRLGSGVSDRLNALGNVDSLVFANEETEEGEPSTGEVIFAEIASGGPLSHQVKYSLPAGVARVRAEVPVQNRTLVPAPYTLNTVLIGDPNIPAAVFGTTRTQGQLAILSEPGTFADLHRLTRRTEGAWLAPRQVDSYAFEILPLPESSEGQSVWMGKEGIGIFQTEPVPALQFHATQPYLGHRLLVQTEDGQNFEASCDIYPENPYVVDFSSIPGTVVAAQIRTSERQIVATIAPTEPVSLVEVTSLTEPLSPSIVVQDLNDADLLNLTASPTYRVAALIELAARAIEGHEWQKADACYEQALLFNGDDALVWWSKSALARLNPDHELQGEQTELLNAHYLAPLEPCLRAEAFLGQSSSADSQDPSPLLAPLAECPENFIEVACQLIDARRFVDAGRFLTEAMHHRDFAMLHYLQGALYITRSKLDFEAAEQLSLGHRAQLPPYPYRRTEWWALRILAERFPTDAKLKTLLTYCPA